MGNLWQRATVTSRVALVAIALAVAAFGAVAYLYLATLSRNFTQLAKDQGLTEAQQIAEATAGVGGAVVAQAIPFTDRGLDGVVFFDRRGRVEAAAGPLSRALVPLAGQARAIARSQRDEQWFQPKGVPGRRFQRLGSGSPPDTVQVTMVPRQGGALAAAFHAERPARQLHSAARNFLIVLLAGIALIGVGLTLMVRRMVSRPLARLGAEVRHIGEGNLERQLSPQQSPELERLATDISRMRNDLIVAMRESSTDPLTGVANHRAFHERLDSAVGAAEGASAPLALISIDLDNFKAINDLCGHSAGDRVLEAVAVAISQTCRASDLCARVGGDEFSIVCPGADAAVAARIGERILAAVRAISPQQVLGRADAPPGLEISASVGVCDMRDRATTKDELIERADAALYEAKASRRGQVRVFGGGNGAAPAAGRDDRRLGATVRALAMAVDAKDSPTRSHSETVAEYAARVAVWLGLGDLEVESLRRAALLHDVGKLGTPDEILCKQGSLLEAEYEVIKQHPVLGARIMASGGLPRREAVWVLHHHEHFDGSGYPDGLRGEEIPLESRILLVADAFEAITSDRPYRTARPAAEALAELRRHAGSQFDPRIVAALEAVVTGAGEDLDQSVEAGPSPTHDSLLAATA